MNFCWAVRATINMDCRQISLRELCDKFWIQRDESWEWRLFIEFCS